MPSTPTAWRSHTPSPANDLPSLRRRLGIWLTSGPAFLRTTPSPILCRRSSASPVDRPRKPRPGIAHLCTLGEPGVDEHESGHRLDNGDGARKHAGIVSSLGL